MHRHLLAEQRSYQSHTSHPKRARQPPCTQSHTPCLWNTQKMRSNQTRGVQRTLSGHRQTNRSNRLTPPERTSCYSNSCVQPKLHYSHRLAFWWIPGDVKDVYQVETAPQVWTMNDFNWWRWQLAWALITLREGEEEEGRRREGEEEEGEEEGKEEEKVL